MVDEIRRERTFTAPEALSRISWGAILAGAVVVIGIQLMLNLLGLGFGFGAIDPAQEAEPFSGLGIGSIIWLILVIIVSLFAGGWAAGRLAGLPRRLDGALHGFLSWGVATLFMLYVLTTAVGGLVGGVVGVVGQGLQAAGQGVAAVAPEVRQALPVEEIAVPEIRQEARQLLREGGEQTETGPAADTPITETEAFESLEQALIQLIESGETADRQEVVDILVENTDLSREEARRAVRRVEQRFRQVRTEIAQTVDSLGQEAVQAAGTATDVLSTVGYVGFFALLIGAIAGVGGGAVGAPTHVRESLVRSEE